MFNSVLSSLGSEDTIVATVTNIINTAVLRTNYAILKIICFHDYKLCMNSKAVLFCLFNTHVETWGKANVGYG